VGVTTQADSLQDRHKDLIIHPDTTVVTLDIPWAFSGGMF
jgi:hypothetical protein